MWLFGKEEFLNISDYCNGIIVVMNLGTNSSYRDGSRKIWKNQKSFLLLRWWLAQFVCIKWRFNISIEICIMLHYFHIGRSCIVIDPIMPVKNKKTSQFWKNHHYLSKKSQQTQTKTNCLECQNLIFITENSTKYCAKIEKLFINQGKNVIFLFLSNNP